MLSHEEYRKTKRKLLIKNGTTKPLKIDKITEFEREHKIIIPEDFKNFLLENNGSEPFSNLFEIEMDGKESIEFSINSFIKLEDLKLWKPDQYYFEHGDEDEDNPKLLMHFAYLDGDHAQLNIGVTEGAFYGKIYYCQDFDTFQLELISNKIEDLINSSLPDYEYEFQECCDCGDLERAKYLINNGYKYPENEYSSLLKDAIESSLDNNLTEIIKLLIEKETKLDNIINKIVHIP